MDKLKAIWAKYKALPWLVQILIGCAAGVIAGRAGAPWIF